MDTLYIVIPAYNEEKNIEKCIDDWYPVIRSHNKSGRSRLVIINDGSTDQTGKLLAELSKSHPLLIPLNKKNGGHGSSVLHGYRFAIAKGADFIFQTDSDRQTNPREFEAFWKRRKKYDAIIGFRTHRGDGKIRKFIEDVVCLLLRFIFGIKVKDANAPFRLMRTSLVAKYINKLPKNYNIPNIMFTTYFVYHHENVKFLPISFKPRQNGINSISIKKIIKIGIVAVFNFYHLRKTIDQ